MMMIDGRHNIIVFIWISIIEKNVDEFYHAICYRNTLLLMNYTSDCRERNKVSKWLDKLDTLDDDDGQLERLQYVKYLVSMLTGSFGLVEPFTSIPPETVRPLQSILPPVVLADLLDDEKSPDTCSRIRRRKRDKSPEKVRLPHSDYMFFEQQLFPPEGLMCYAAAFSCLWNYFVRVKLNPIYTTIKQIVCASFSVFLIRL